jgi:hypothetical protein
VQCVQIPSIETLSALGLASRAYLKYFSQTLSNVTFVLEVCDRGLTLTVKHFSEVVITILYFYKRPLK